MGGERDRLAEPGLGVTVITAASGKGVRGMLPLTNPRAGYWAGVSRPRIARDRALFDPGYVERNPFFLAVYAIGVRSARLRAFVLRLPLGRARMALVGRFLHRSFKDWHEGGGNWRGCCS